MKATEDVIKKLESAAQAIREYHARGKDILKASKGKQSVSSLAKSEGYKPQLAYKTRKFAEAYTDDELEELVSIDTENPLPMITWQQVIALLPEPNKKHRRELQQEAREKCLHPDEITARRNKSTRKKASGGRRQACLTSADGPRKLERWFDESQRYCAALTAAPEKRKTKNVRPVEGLILGMKVRDIERLASKISALSERLGEVHKTCRDVLKKKRRRKR